jgi:acetylornithine deacetylase
MQMPPIDREYTIGTCQSLVRINSINPTLVPGAPGEREVADYTAKTLGALGLMVQRHEPEPGRVSITGRLKGTGGGRSLMLNAHYDTVGIDGMPEPFSADVRNGRLYGRGSYDMKGSLAACIGAVKAIVDAGTPLRGDIVIAAVADEEYGSLGTADILTKIRTDGAIVTEPTALNACLAHKGYLWIEVVTEGRAAHGSKVEFGLDANMRMGWFLAELSTLEQELRARTPHPLIGPPSLHAALLAGGAGLSTYSPRCTLQIERRTIPGETEAQVMAEINAIIDRLSTRDATFKATARSFFVRPPFEVAREAGLVRALSGAFQTTLGRAPVIVGDTPWMDSALTSEAGIETMVFGPGGTGAHADEEYVEVDSMIDCAAVLAATAREWCA